MSGTTMDMIFDENESGNMFHFWMKLTRLGVFLLWIALFGIIKWCPVLIRNFLTRKVDGKKYTEKLLEV